MAEYSIHPLAAMFPRMVKEDFDALVKSLKRDGLENPITLATRIEHDNEETIVDGINRREGCRVAKITPRYETLGEMTEAEIAAYIVRANINRRHISKGQIAIIYAMMYPNPKKKGPRKVNAETAHTLPPPIGISDRRIQEARQVVKYSLPLAEAVRDGGVNAPLFDDAVLQVRRYLLSEKKREQELKERAEELEEIREQDPDLAGDIEIGEVTFDQAQAILAEREEMAEEEAEFEESLKGESDKDESLDEDEDESVTGSGSAAGPPIPFNQWQDVSGAAIRAAEAQLVEVQKYEEYLGQLSIESIDVLLRDALLVHETWLKIANMLRGHTSQERHLSVVSDK